MSTINKSLQTAYGVLLTNPGNVDPLYGPFTSTADADASVNISLRPYRTVGIVVSGTIIEYWWPTTTCPDGSLIVKEVPLPQGLGTGDSPTFAGITVTGANSTTFTKNAPGSSSALIAETYANPNTQNKLANLKSVNDITREYNELVIEMPTPANGDGNHTYGVVFQKKSHTVAGLDDVASAVSAGNLFVGKFVSLSALQTAFPTGIDGNYAFVYGSVSDQQYIWDSDHSQWVLTSVIPAGTFAALGGSPTDNTALAAAINGKVDKVTGYALISLADQTKLNGIATGATANDTDANLKARANHTGTQLASTISDFASTLWATVLTGLSTATSSVITATDTVLSAFGKLQAQVSNKVDKITGKGLSTNDYTTTEQTKLSGIAIGATANDTDANLKARANHTGTQTASTISDFGTAVVAALPQNLGTGDSPHFFDVNLTGSLAAGGTVQATDLLIKNGGGKTLTQAATPLTADRNIVWPDKGGTPALLDDVALKDNAAIGFNDQTGTAYTAVLADASCKIRMTNAAANVVTIPTNASVAFPIGSYFYVSMNGTGQTSIVGASGVTVQGYTTKIDVQYNEALVWKEGTNTWKVIGIAPDISALDSPTAYIKNIAGTNTIDYEATIMQPGGAGNAINFSGSSQYYTAADTGFPTGTSVSMTVSFWVKSSVDVVTPFCYGGLSSGGFTVCLIGGQVAIYNGTSSLTAYGSTPASSSGAWMHYVIVVSGSTFTAYINNTSYNLGSGTHSYNISTNGTMTNYNSGLGGGYSKGSIDQLCVWNRALSRTSGAGSSDEIAQIYASGAGTQSIPTSGLIRRYEFEDGVGSTAVETSGVSGGPYNMSLFNSPIWLGAGNAIVPTVSASVLAQYAKFEDGVGPGEKGRYTGGNFNCGYRLTGRSIKHLINTNGSLPYIALYHGFNGKMLLNPTNTTEEPSVASTYDVAGNVTIGASYAGTNAAPANGLLVQGRTLMGTTTDNLTDQLQVSGNINLVGVGNKIKIATGTNASVGTATLVAGVATVSTTAVTTSSRIFFSVDSPSGTAMGILTKGSVSGGSNFIVNSLRPASLAIETGDTSTFNWWIVN